MEHRRAVRHRGGGQQCGHIGRGPAAVERRLDRAGRQRPAGTDRREVPLDRSRPPPTGGRRPVTPVASRLDVLCGRGAQHTATVSALGHGLRRQMWPLHVDGPARLVDDWARGCRRRLGRLGEGGSRAVGRKPPGTPPCAGKPAASDGELASPYSAPPASAAPRLPFPMRRSRHTDILISGPPERSDAAHATDIATQLAAFDVADQLQRSVIEHGLVLVGGLDGAAAGSRPAPGRVRWAGLLRGRARSTPAGRVVGGTA